MLIFPNIIIHFSFFFWCAILFFWHLFLACFSASFICLANVRLTIRNKSTLNISLYFGCLNSFGKKNKRFNVAGEKETWVLGYVIRVSCTHTHEGAEAQYEAGEPQEPLWEMNSVFSHSCPRIVSAPCQGGTSSTMIQCSSSENDLCNWGVSLPRSKGHIMGCWGRAFWDFTGQYRMFRGRTKGGEREGSRWFEEEQIWKNSGIRG